MATISEDCIFCRIIQRQMPAKIIYDDDTTLAFEDIHPQAPVHFLVVPRKHLASLTETGAEEEALIGHLFAVSAKLASERGLDSGGYRTVINNGERAGQTVFHLHVHVMGGRMFHWPPG